MMKNPHVIWASVVIISLMTTAGIILSVLDKDVTVLLTIMTAVTFPLLGAFGMGLWQKLGQVQDISNGNLTRQMEQNARNQEDLMRMFRELHPGLKTDTPPD